MNSLNASRRAQELHVEKFDRILPLSFLTEHSHLQVHVIQHKILRQGSLFQENIEVSTWIVP